MKFTATTVATVFFAATLASAQQHNARDLGDLIDKGLSKLDSKIESATSAFKDVTSSGSSIINSAKTAFNEASASASYKANPSDFTFPALPTPTDNADKLYSYITSVDKFIPTKVVDEWKDGETPKAVASFVKELPEKYTAAAKDGWSSLSKEVAKATTTAAAKKDEKKDDDDDEESAATRGMGIAMSVAALAGMAGLAIIL